MTRAKGDRCCMGIGRDFDDSITSRQALDACKC